MRYARRLDEQAPLVAGRALAEEAFKEKEPHVLLERPHVWVLAKPPGWQVTVGYDDGPEVPFAAMAGAVPGRGRHLQDWVTRRLGPLSPIARDGAAQHGLPHRLDLGTSGIILCARTYYGYYLSKLQFSGRRVWKGYVCLCNGRVPVAPRLLEAPLRPPAQRQGGWSVDAGTGGGLAALGGGSQGARTEILAVAHLIDGEGEAVSLVEIRLHTGRRHQIRAHLAGEGHPLVADAAYGGVEKLWCPRIFLHACRLCLEGSEGPAADVSVEVTCPLPRDLQGALRTLVAAGSEGASFLVLLRKWLGEAGVENGGPGL